MLDDYQRPLDSLEFQDAVYGLSKTLRELTCRARFFKRPDFLAAERARTLMNQGHALADTAVACRFADQSHLTRRFRKAFGITPTRWTACFRAGSGRTIVP
ncbi:helix-turn-helix domain-containing protein [Oleiagrimonas sp.]|uniref:helix-turn-helix domain-containing protein n=1 Tax=Oleiagrimonas sp. TaxID=2010330 RepID=UPI00260663AD|nr:helix-turn-helix domain-containing protein [Oleiagrimonas sp.]MDA3915244.1 helix-turn-helix domain-containing protein [Oleiagrimonas sp.]